MKKILLSCLFLISMAMHAQIHLGTGSTSVGPAPISNYYGYSYVQQIFTKQEINADSSGNITGLKFYMNPSASLANSSNWTVYLGYTTNTSFGAEENWFPLAQLTQVFAGTAVNNNGVVSINFAAPFFYNNLDNLVVAAKESDPNYDGGSEAFYVYDSSPNSSLYFRSDFINPDPMSSLTGTLTDQKSLITFEGLTAQATPPCPTITYPANNAIFVSIHPNITWVAVPGATQYRISVGTTPGGTEVVNQQLTSNTDYTPSVNLVSNTLYYVKLSSLNGTGESVGCTDTQFTTSPPQPTNDECSTAIELTVNPDLNGANMTFGYNLGATDSGLMPYPCDGLPNNDVWFKFTATATTQRISLHDVQSIGEYYSTDIDFQVLGGSCGSLSSIVCSDFTSSLVSGLTVGETYYIRVYSFWGSGNAQRFNICLGTLPPAPANDDCLGALAVSSFPYNFTQSDARGSTNNNGFISVCSDDDMNDGTWFTFIGNGGNMEISVSMPNGSDFDPQLGVYSGNCNDLTCEGTVDDGEDGDSEIISLATVLGKTYYVNVGHYSGYTDELEGAFTINITTNVLGTAETVVKKEGVKAYPNPFTDILNISDISNVKSISVTDISGRLIKTIDKPSSTLHLGELKQGMYLMTLHKKDGSNETLKVIKK